ncbi:MAG: spondin domain-containing protein [Trueperaceae bacterium]|nr:spondin domain-containing protein [Trueperaceae bacterium]
MIKRLLLTLTLIASLGLALAQDTTEFVIRIDNVSSAVDEGSTTDRIDDFAVLLSPGIYLVHTDIAPLFTPGRLDRGEGLEALAENGDPTVLARTLDESADRTLIDVGTFTSPMGTSASGPIGPGESYEFTITAAPGQEFTFATMYVQSNDIFLAPSEQGIQLFDTNGNPIDAEVTSAVFYWNAGTEESEQPGEGIFQAPRQPRAGAGEVEGDPIRRLDSAAAVDEVNQSTVEDTEEDVGNREAGEDFGEIIDDDPVDVVDSEGGTGEGSVDDANQVTYVYPAVEDVIRVTITPRTTTVD